MRWNLKCHGEVSSNALWTKQGKHGIAGSLLHIQADQCKDFIVTPALGYVQHFDERFWVGRAHISVVVEDDY